MSSPQADRLYNLLPAAYRLRDAKLGEPLRGLLGVITEQVNLVEADIGRLHANWFIETCEEWVVPYIGDLIGYRPIHDAGEPAAPSSPAGQRRERIVFPRRDVAKTIANRRRKGTVALLEQLADEVAGWPARAVEFYTLVAVAQSLRQLRLARGRTVDLREGDALDRLDGPFDELARTVSVPRLSSPRRPSRHNIPNVALFVWRLKPYAVTGAPAYCIDRARNHYMFSVLGNNTPLMTRPIDEPDPTHIADEMNVPAWIRRRAFDERTADYYGRTKSLRIWRDRPDQPVALNQIVPADLSQWAYRPQGDQVAVDPVLGRIAFSPHGAPESGVWVSYCYGFSHDMGGGQYPRSVGSVAGYTQAMRAQAGERPGGPPTGRRIYRVGSGAPFDRIVDALTQWRAEKPERAVVEIVDNGVYAEQLRIALDGGQLLELRAANGSRPTIRLLDWYTNRPDAMRIERETDDAQDRPLPRLVLDGLLVTGRSIQVLGRFSEVVVRHCTLVPGWALDHECQPENEVEPSLELEGSARLTIDHSIVGTVRIGATDDDRRPVPLAIRDSIIDATRTDYEALSGPDGRHANALLSIARSTVIGRVMVHAVELAENTIFDGSLRVARRQTGCVRFCHVPPDSRTPTRYHCQPDLVVDIVEAAFQRGELTRSERNAGRIREALRVRPEFNSTRYGMPTYCQLGAGCASEITTGGDDDAEMGAFHDLFQPQRATNLAVRLGEYCPAGMDPGIIFVT